MSDISAEELRNLNIREQIARIDQMLAAHDRDRQQIVYTPWQIIGGLVISGMTAGAAFFAAGIAFVKLLH